MEGSCCPLMEQLKSESTEKEFLGVVGKSVTRVDAWDKVTGRAQYIDDIPFPGCWYGGTVRSDVPRGKIVGIRQDPSFDWSKVVFVTAKDLPGPNEVAMVRCDMPILAEDIVNYVSEPIALVAAPTKALLKAALKAVKVEIEPLEPVLSIEEALEGKNVIWGDDNVLAKFEVKRGDVDEAFKEADIIIEETYRTGHQEQLYLEPQGMVALPRDDGGVEVVGSLQCPYYIHGAMTHALNLPPDKVVIKQAVTGGGFGGKEDFPSLLAIHAAVLALKVKRPVKIIYDRAEDMVSTTKRHPSKIRHRTGVKKDGTIVAQDIDLILDGGAYTTLSIVVLQRSLLHATGCYNIPNARILARAVATNTPPNGAFRGFGAPQSIFAMERQMDKIARTLGLSPIEVRRKNLLKSGDAFPFGQRVEDDGARLVFERALAISEYERKRTEYSKDQGPKRRGIGVSLFLHGGGFTGSGEQRINGKIKLRLTGDEVELYVSNVDMGQGAATVLAQIAAQGLKIPFEKVRYCPPDTSKAPDSGPTVASRTTMIVGKIVLRGTEKLIGRLKEHVSRYFDVSLEDIAYENGVFLENGTPLADFFDIARRIEGESGPLEVMGNYVHPQGLSWDDEKCQGDAYQGYAWGANVLEVEVDTDTWEVRPLRDTVVVDVGTAINPLLAVGQVEGGSLQGLGYGYLEVIEMEGGRYRNNRLSNYAIPTSVDCPDFFVELMEIPCSRGAFGAKGLGEMPLNGGGPAVAAAIEHATGLFANRLPVTGEVLTALEQKGDERRS